MKMLIMLLLTVILAACGTPQADNTPQDVEISVQPQSEPLAVGESILLVTLRNASGAPIDGAEVHIHANMDHEGMEPIDVETSQSASGEYTIPLVWSMGGGWIVTVDAELPDGGEVSKTVEYFVEVASGESIINQHSD